MPSVLVRRIQANTGFKPASLLEGLSPKTILNCEKRGFSVDGHAIFENRNRERPLILYFEKARTRSDSVEGLQREIDCALQNYKERHELFGEQLESHVALKPATPGKRAFWRLALVLLPRPSVKIVFN